MTTPASRKPHTPRLLAAALCLLALALALAPTGLAKNDKKGHDNGGASGDHGNSGTIKVHDEATASPKERNEPHVDCTDFWIEGFNMNADSGNLFFYSWPPTGDKKLVLEDTWSADGKEPAHHFLNGPYTLPAGHYRVGASNGPATADDFPGGMKKKTFWVDDCQPATGMDCPSDLQAVAQAGGSIELTFTPVDSSSGTNVYRGTSADDLEYLATVPAGQGSYVDTTSQGGASYAYSVTALFGSEESQDCPIVEATAIPELPTVAALGLASTGGLAALVMARRRKA